MKGKGFKIRRVLWVAVWIIVPAFIFVALVAVVRKTADVALQRRARNDTGIYAQAPPEAILAYTQAVPLRPKANQFAEVEDTLSLSSNQQTGLRESIGYLTGSEVGGVRINPDGSVWVVVIRKEENIWVEYYAPSRYFKIIPGTGKVSFMKDIKFH